jgi:hypothetical protein
MGGLSMLGARRVVAVAALLVVCCRAASAQLPTVRDPGQGVVSLSSGSTAAAELSGITWTGGANYLAVGDNGAQAIWTISAGVSGVSGNHLRIAFPPRGSRVARQQEDRCRSAFDRAIL